jgi:hypothetical protein
MRRHRSEYDTYYTNYYDNKAENYDTNTQKLEFTNSNRSHLENFTFLENNLQITTINMNAVNKQIYYNDDGTIDTTNSCYFDYYCLNNTIETWKIPENGRPSVGSLYVTNDPQLPACQKKKGREYPGFATVIFKITFDDLQKQQIIDTPQPVHGLVLCNNKIISTDTQPTIYKFNINFPTKISSSIYLH